MAAESVYAGCFNDRAPIGILPAVLAVAVRWHCQTAGRSPKSRVPPFRLAIHGRPVFLIAAVRQRPWVDARRRASCGTLKMRMGATHFLMKRLPKVATRLVPSAVEECSGNPIAGACSVEMSFLSAMAFFTQRGPSLRARSSFWACIKIRPRAGRKRRYSK